MEIEGDIELLNGFLWLFIMDCELSDQIDDEETIMENGALAKAIYSFKTDIDGELSLEVGDVVQIKHTVDRHWYYGTNGFQSGNFPAGFVVEREMPSVGTDQELFVSFENFAVVESGDLGFNKNDVILGTKPIDSNWYYGESDGRQGIFPVTHVWKVDLSLVKQKQSSHKVRMKAKVKMDMTAQLEEEMNLVKGEIITVTEIIDKDWMRGQCKGQSGIFPSAYVVLEPDDKTQDEKPAETITESLPATNEQMRSSVPGYNCSNSGISPYGRTCYSFVAQYPDELGFHAGELVNILRHVDSEWLEGELGGSCGFFPKSHIDIIVDCASNDTDAKNNPVPEPQIEIIPGVTEATVLYDYIAQGPEDLILVQDEIITINKKLNNDWYEATDSQGNVGLCPSNYVVISASETVGATKECNNNRLEKSLSITSDTGTRFMPIERKFDFSKIRCLSDTEALDKSIAKNLANMDLSLCATPKARSVSFTQVSRQKEKEELIKMSLSTPPPRPSPPIFVEKSISPIPPRPPPPVVSLPAPMIPTPSIVLPELPPKPIILPDLPQKPTIPPDLPQKPTIPPDLPQKPTIPLDLPQKPMISPDLPQKPMISPDLPQKPMIPLNLPQKPTIPFDLHLHRELPPPPTLLPESPTPPSLPPELPPLPRIPPELPPPPMLPPKLPPPPIIQPKVPPPMISVRQMSQNGEKMLAPFRAAPPPPAKLIVHNIISHQQQTTTTLEADTSLRVPHRPAPPPPIALRPKDYMDPLIGLQRKISERENNLKQLKSAKQELDCHVISRQSSEDAMQDHVKAYEDTIDGLTDEISSLKALQNNCEEPEVRAKNVEKRKLVIMELVKTEQDYVVELKLCLDVFLKSSNVLKAKGIDFVVLFGNLDQIIKLAEQLVDNFKANSGEVDVDNILIGTCFENIAPAMKEEYANYCSNHDEVIHLLEKYQENESIQNFISQKINIIRETIPCFSLGAILIKPVQRILKYPLLLNELIKATDDEHPDMIHLQKAIHVMTDVATSINEYKRRREIVVKYRQDEDTSLATTFSKINLHSLVKKSNRIGMRLSSTIGLTSVTKDETFDVEEQKFRALDKTIKTFVKDVTEFCILLEEWVTGQFHVGEHFASIFADQCRLPHFDQYRSIVQRELFQVIWKDFVSDFVRYSLRNNGMPKNSAANSVVHPLSDLLHLFHGPTKLIDKRYDKLLDYDSSTKKVEKNKEMSKAKQLREEQSMMKSMYEALNEQLIEELPKFFTLSLGIFLDCTIHFYVARKKFIGKLSKEMLSLMDIPVFNSYKGDILDDFETKRANVVSQLTTFNFIPKNFFIQRMDSIRDKKAKSNANKENVQTDSKQTDAERERIKIQYPPPNCYCAIKPFQTTDKFEIALSIGDIVGVIKQQDPMGGTNKWFIDKGAIKGFVPAEYLVPIPNGTGTGNREKHRRSSANHPSIFVPSGNQQASLQPTQSNTEKSVLIVNLPPEPHTIQTEDAPPAYYDLPLDDELTDQRYDLPCDDYEEVLETNKEVYAAAYDFNSSLTGTLNLARGEIVNVIQKHDMDGSPEWWYMETMTGKKGYVPRDYLMKR
uniref:Dynamin-binding protein n=1 Tax=Strigamia maritima TaxID=126957 RepID=T1IVY4_STRMM